MKFVAEHPFACVTLAQFEQLYFDEAFNEALCADGGLQRRLLSCERDAQRLRRSVEIFPERQLPAAAQKLMGAERLGYIEHVDYTFGSYTCAFRIDAAVMADKVTSGGSVTFAADGHGGVVRRVEGEVKVAIFGLGGTIERLIVADVSKSYGRAAAFTAQYLAQQRQGAGASPC